MSQAVNQNSSITEKMRLIVSTPALATIIAAACDRRYNEIARSPWHDPNNFLPPFDMKKHHSISSNVLALHAVISELQEAAQEQGAVRREDIAALIIPELRRIVASPDYRALVPQALMDIMPLDIAFATELFGLQNLDYLRAANSLWNGFQAARFDKGPLGAMPRSNVFSELPLSVLMLDWDQVLVVAKELLALLEGDALFVVLQERTELFAQLEAAAQAKLSTAEVEVLASVAEAREENLAAAKVEEASGDDVGSVPAVTDEGEGKKYALE